MSKLGIEGNYYKESIFLLIHVDESYLLIQDTYEWLHRDTDNIEPHEIHD